LLVQEYFKSRLDLVEDALKKYLTPANTYPEQLNEAIHYSVFSNGKRLRPILFLATYEMLIGRKNINRLERLLPVACALELVHTASLIHDDLPSVDNSNERRGKPSCHVKFGSATAILAGDALITKAIEVITKLKNKNEALEAIKILTLAVSTRGMIGGQAVDIVSAKKKINKSTLRYIHLKKTGSLLLASTELACMFDKTEDSVRITLGNFALNLGLAYQIVDDILDEVGSFEVLGKKSGGDAKNQKATYPSVFGLETSKTKAEKLLRDCYDAVKNMSNNEILLEYVDMIKDRLP